MLELFRRWRISRRLLTIFDINFSVAVATIALVTSVWIKLSEDASLSLVINALDKSKQIELKKMKLTRRQHKRHKLV